jgi:hypothetical protein
MMDDLQITVAVLLGVIFIPVPLVFLFVWLCCRKDICHLRQQRRSQERRGYRPMLNLLAKMTDRNSDASPAPTSSNDEEKVERKNSNPEQVFASPLAPQFE